MSARAFSTPATGSPAAPTSTPASSATTSSPTATASGNGRNLACCRASLRPRRAFHPRHPITPAPASERSLR
ncbi:hypothetical protein LUX57_48375 [Actinomadura madurae]|uniref:hypothetical protein n=1 Tax=Actinomadura madurae TaxID=1993 RepID=UPI0020D20CA5|nr:hypothetical protein [Actinomadura madurae]MCP9971939.1 hypothetical protein [Actinomadura madurae]